MIFREYNIPIKLTLIRLVLSPICIPFLLVYFLPYNNSIINSLLAIVFILFGMTDFFDGYLARRYQQETDLGKILDPIADKFLIYSTLIALLAIGKIYFFWVILFIGREFFVMTLRHIALENNFSINVSLGGKVKTAIQFIMLSFIIFNPYHHLGIVSCARWNLVEFVIIVIALFLSLYTAYNYYKVFMERFVVTKPYETEVYLEHD